MSVLTSCLSLAVAPTSCLQETPYSKTLKPYRMMSYPILIRSDTGKGIALAKCCHLASAYTGPCMGHGLFIREVAIARTRRGLRILSRHRFRK